MVTLLLDRGGSDSLLKLCHVLRVQATLSFLPIHWLRNSRFNTSWFTSSRVASAALGHLLTRASRSLRPLQHLLQLVAFQVHRAVLLRQSVCFLRRLRVSSTLNRLNISAFLLIPCGSFLTRRKFLLGYGALHPSLTRGRFAPTFTLLILTLTDFGRGASDAWLRRRHNSISRFRLVSNRDIVLGLVLALLSWS